MWGEKRRNKMNFCLSASEERIRRVDERTEAVEREPSACFMKLYWSYRLFGYDLSYHSQVLTMCCLMTPLHTILYVSYLTWPFIFFFSILWSTFSPVGWQDEKKHCKQTVMNKSVPTYPLSSPPLPGEARVTMAHTGILPDRRKHLALSPHLLAGRSYENQREAAEEAQARVKLRLAMSRREGRGELFWSDRKVQEHVQYMSVVG